MERAEAAFRKQFHTPDEYAGFLKQECNGSQQVLREKIRRSLLIEALLKLEVNNKSTVSLAQVKAYYDKNPEQFRVAESFSIQTISILPPPNATPEQLKEARKRAEDASRQAKATKNYEEFGLLAEKLSEDDYRVMMGDHKAVDRTKLPPAVLQAVLAMQPGQVSDLIQIDQAYTVVRFNSRVPAGMQKFDAVKDGLRKDLQNTKTQQLRSNLGKQLRKNAKVEEL
jgi:parvulin-like peptidyl-prolyl isomerase